MKKIILLSLLIINFHEAHTQIVRRNIGAIMGAVDRMDRAHEEALQIRNSLISDIMSIQLNVAEFEWRKNYVDKITKRIDAASSFGNYSSALSVARKVQQETYQDVALLGRYYANQNYEDCKRFMSANMSGEDYFAAVDECKLNINDLCRRYGVSIYRIESKSILLKELGEELFLYAMLVSQRPGSYRDWLYLLYLSANCGNSDAEQQCKSYGIMDDKSMFQGHSNNLF